jgi:iron complex transport system ATP-binding protein
MSALLETTSASVRRGTSTLLNDVTISFDRGESVAVIGPNGAGKSTLLRVLSGELAPQSGYVRLCGRQLTSYSPNILATHRAVLSQHINIAFPFTVADVVRMGIKYQRGCIIETLVDATLAELGLDDLADRAITTLSGGEQQLVHFARVLVQLAYGRDQGGVGILLLDEPTASLDLHHQLRMVEALQDRVKQGVLVVAIFHDLNLASLFARRVVVLNSGRIDSEGRPEETITGEMLARVFGIETAVTLASSSHVPLVLPQYMRTAKRLNA